MLILSDEQQMLRDSARGFLATHAPVAHQRALRDAKERSDFPATCGNVLSRWVGPVS